MIASVREEWLLTRHFGEFRNSRVSPKISSCPSSFQVNLKVNLKFLEKSTSLELHVPVVKILLQDDRRKRRGCHSNLAKIFCCNVKRSSWSWTKKKLRKFQVYLMTSSKLEIFGVSQLPTSWILLWNWEPAILLNSRKRNASGWILNIHLGCYNYSLELVVLYVSVVQGVVATSNWTTETWVAVWPPK